MSSLNVLKQIELALEPSRFFAEKNSRGRGSREAKCICFKDTPPRRDVVLFEHVFCSSLGLTKLVPKQQYGVYATKSSEVVMVTLPWHTSPFG